MKFKLLAILLVVISAVLLIRVAHRPSMITLSSTDVKGSDNVVVTSYTAGGTTYILWASGRITNAISGGNVVTTDPSGWKAPSAGIITQSPGTSPVQGSPWVAIGVIPIVDNVKGNITCVLFKNGKIMDPPAADGALGAVASGTWQGGYVFRIYTNGNPPASSACPISGCDDAIPPASCNTSTNGYGSCPTGYNTVETGVVTGYDQTSTPTFYNFSCDGYSYEYTTYACVKQ